MEKVACTPSIGADVEWFLYDEDEAVVVPACGLIGGTKEEPLPLAGMPEGFAIQEDNVMVEWNIPPAERWDAFYHNIIDGIEAVREHVSEKTEGKYIVEPFNEWTFKPSQLRSDQAKTFGCEPDFDAYLGGVQRRDGARDILGNVRTCGGHVHLGGDFQCPDFVAALFAEFYIGVLGYLPMDFNSTRQKWYGQPGVYRPKPYGIEYRTPDNMWTEETSSVEYVALYAMKCAQFLTNTPGDELQQMFRKFPWVRLREYMSGKQRGMNGLRKELVQIAKDIGLPT